MAFPTGPSNGQTAIINQTAYQYNSTYGTWTVISNSLLNISYVTRTATGNGSLATYTVTSGCSQNQTLVTLDGVMQTPGTDYTISGTVLTFTTAPASGAAIQIRELPR